VVLSPVSAMPAAPANPISATRPVPEPPSPDDNPPETGPATPPKRPPPPTPVNPHNLFSSNDLQQEKPAASGAHVAYYGYRYYDPLTGRWPSRDPIVDIAFRHTQIQSLGLDWFVDQVALRIPKNSSSLFTDSQESEEDLLSGILPFLEKNLYQFSDNNPLSLIDFLGLLQYSTLALNYPTPAEHPTEVANTYSIWKLVGGKVQQNGESGTFTNSCAIRMSHALNGSGIQINFASGKTSSGKNPPKWWYYFRVNDLKDFISDIFGTADSYTKEEFKKNCKKGIVILNVPWQDATGHADLWDGKHMIDGHDDYIDLATSIQFWEVEDVGGW
jgi:Type VI secretion system (T6SS), amidase effector protein 4